MLFFTSIIFSSVVFDWLARAHSHKTTHAINATNQTGHERIVTTAPNQVIKEGRTSQIAQAQAAIANAHVAMFTINSAISGFSFIQLLIQVNAFKNTSSNFSMMGTNQVAIFSYN
jgi:hypothetical protein